MRRREESGVKGVERQEKRGLENIERRRGGREEKSKEMKEQKLF